MGSDPGADFPLTRKTIDQLDGWVQRLAAPLLPAECVEYKESVWEFREETPLALAVSKIVRMASGIRAAMLLVDAGFVAKCACLLRIVGDLDFEVVAVIEGEIRGEMTTAQQKFIDQFFSRPAMDSVSISGPPKNDHVSRKDLMKAHVKLAEAAGQDGEEIRHLIRKLNWGYDGYVHGSYSSAMELYHGGRDQFMLRGHEGEELRRRYRRAVSVKLVELLNTFRLVAIAQGDKALSSELAEAAAELMSSQEQMLASGGG